MRLLIFALSSAAATEWQTRTSALRDALENAASPRPSAVPLSPFDRMGTAKNDNDAFPAEVIRTPLPEEYLSSKALPVAFDWRAVTVADDAPPVHYTTRVRNQFLPLWCGSCWAHAATAVLGARWLIHSKSTTYSGIDFSVQYFVNCVNISSRGCGGGSSYQAFAHAHNYGAVDSSCLPYSAVTQQCTPHDTCQQNLHDTSKHPTINTAKPIRYYVSEYGQLGTDGMAPQQKEEAMLKELYARGPIASCMACPDDFEDNYKGGILAVNTSRSVCDHIVAIVGFGGEGDKAYWIVQNSFGSVWGEQGYFRIKRSSALQEGEHNLGIEKRVSWAMPA